MSHEDNKADRQEHYLLWRIIHSLRADAQLLRKHFPPREPFIEFRVEAAKAEQAALALEKLLRAVPTREPVDG